MAMERSAARRGGGDRSEAPVQGDPGIMEGKAKPNTASQWTCSPRSDQGNDRASLLPVLVPILVGLALGPQALAAC